MIQVALSIGSNLGDRFANLQFALDELVKCGCKVVACSAIYETDPVGGVEQDSFLNLVAIVETELEAKELLQSGLIVENLADRVREVRWGPRTLDIDLIDVLGFSSDTEQLTVPHPRAHERAFVLVPLFEIAPEWKLGGTSPVSELLAEVENQKVTKRADLKLKEWKV